MSKLYETPEELPADELAQEILQDHRKDNHRVYLLTSAMHGEGVSFVTTMLQRELRHLHDGEIIVLQPSVHCENRADDPLRKTVCEAIAKDDAIVLIDASGVLDSSSPTGYLDICDACILVVRAGRTRRAVVIEVVQRIIRHGLPVIGAVLNGEIKVIPDFIYKRIM